MTLWVLQSLGGEQPVVLQHQILILLEQLAWGLVHSKIVKFGNCSTTEQQQKYFQN